ncbi:MAG: hypothetical protein ACKOBT_12620 [Actinomycetota bacterium]
MTYPAASRALLEGLQAVASVHFDTEALEHEAVIQCERLNRLVARNSEHAEMVAKLEVAYDSLNAPASRPAISPMSESDLPSADELAAELEAFLRDANPEI